MRTRRTACWSVLVALGVAACSHPAPFSDAQVDIADIHDSGTGATAIGSPCGLGPNGEALGGCSAGETCLSDAQGFPNGYCSQDCARASCPTGSVCLPITATQRVCVLACSSDADCRASDGYTCEVPGPAQPHPACIPNSHPVGTAPDGGACFDPGADDAGTGPFLAPLPSVTFDGRSTDTELMMGLDGEAEPTIVTDPTRPGGALVAWTGSAVIMMNEQWRGGLVRMASDATLASGALFPHDPDFPSTSSLLVAFDRHQRLHAMTWAIDFGRPSASGIHYFSSDDDGVTLSTRVWVVPETMCAYRCDAPAMAIGPATDPTRDTIYAVARVWGSTHDHPPMTTHTLVFAASPTESAAFTPPVTLAGPETTVDATRDPVVATVAPGSTPGSVLVAWVASNDSNPLSGLGDPRNRVRLRVSTDGGANWGDPVDVSRAGMDTPVAQPPWVATGGGVTHVVFVDGSLTGVWNVVLATRADGASSWSYRTVNDEPACATHGFVGMAVDPATGEAHVVWLDNRFGAGEVAYARCPADATQRCSRNELVSGAPFVFTTTQDSSSWLGTHASVALGDDGSIWTAWTDTRSGGPHVYVAHGHRSP